MNCKRNGPRLSFNCASPASLPPSGRLPRARAATRTHAPLQEISADAFPKLKRRRKKTSPKTLGPSCVERTARRYPASPFVVSKQQQHCPARPVCFEHVWCFPSDGLLFCKYIIVPPIADPDPDKGLRQHATRLNQHARDPNAFCSPRARLLSPCCLRSPPRL